jgi:hypothetical protein
MFLVAACSLTPTELSKSKSSRTRGIGRASGNMLAMLNREHLELCNRRTSRDGGALRVVDIVLLMVVLA